MVMKRDQCLKVLVAGALCRRQSRGASHRGPLHVIEQAMGTLQRRPAGSACLREFIEEMKACGFVARELQRSGQSDAAVAPPAP